MAIIYMSNGEEERAIETYRKALEENPNQPSCLKNMGLIYEKWGRIAEESGEQDAADRWLTRPLTSGPRPCASIPAVISISRTG